MNKLNVIYEDNHIIVVEKQPNIPSQADKTEDIDMLTIIKEYIKELGKDYEEMKNKAILIDNRIIGKYDSEKGKYVEKNLKVFDYKENDTINCKTRDEKNFEIKIGLSTDILPFGFNQESNYFMIISEEVFEKYFKSDNIMIYYDSTNPDKLQDDIDELLNDYNYNINNVEENARMMEKLYTLVGIFLYGFIIVITAIGVTNVFNAITANMELRKPEFAMLKSVGMTTKEFNRMIRLETVFMGIKSLLFSIPIGIGLSYLIYYALDKDKVLKFTIPINAIIIAIVAVFLLILLLNVGKNGFLSSPITIRMGSATATKSLEEPPKRRPRKLSGRTSGRLTLPESTSSLRTSLWPTSWQNGLRSESKKITSLPPITYTASL